MAKRSAWPFVFLHHGLWRHRDQIKAAHWSIVFDLAVPAGERSEALAGRPLPASGPAKWALGGRILYLESPPERYFDASVHRAHGPHSPPERDDIDPATFHEDDELTKEQAQAFVDAFDAWLGHLHARHSIALVFASHGSRKDAWSKWSVGEVPRRVLPLLRALTAEARSPSDATRQPSSPERLMGWAAREAIGAYFEIHDNKTLDDGLRAEMIDVLASARGHDEFVDAKLTWLMGYLEK